LGGGDDDVSVNSDDADEVSESDNNIHIAELFNLR
jgi:hypothetical protein